jgi:hypothetical protein
MESDPSGGFPTSAAMPMQKTNGVAFQEACKPVSVEMKVRQSAKIRELADAVQAAGFRTLDQQAQALGLSRSTVWTIRKASHKASGLSASIINRMLAAPQLPPLARSKIMEYVEEKAAGLYGGPTAARRRFADRLSIKQVRWGAVYEEMAL